MQRPTRSAVACWAASSSGQPCHMAHHVTRRQHATRTSPSPTAPRQHQLDLCPFLCPHRWAQWCYWTHASTCRTAPPTCRRWAATSWWRRVRQAAERVAAAAAATHGLSFRCTPTTLQACLLCRCYHSACCLVHLDAADVRSSPRSLRLPRRPQDAGADSQRVHVGQVCVRAMRCAAGPATAA